MIYSISFTDHITCCRIICDALGISHKASDHEHLQRTTRSKVITNVVLEAEMVAFSDSLDKIDGEHIFHIRSLMCN